MAYQNQAVDMGTRGEILEGDGGVWVTLGRRERVRDDGGHQVENGVRRRDPFERPLRERGISSTLGERTGLDKFDDGDLARGGLLFALAGLLGFRCSALGGVLRGGFYLGR